MNDDPKNLEQRLEAITGLGESRPDELDADDASLREAWVAFGRLLDAAAPDAGERPAPPSPVETTSGTPQPRRWALAAALAVAASILVAVAAVGLVRVAGRGTGEPPSPRDVAVGDPAPAITPTPGRNGEDTPAQAWAWRPERPTPEPQPPQPEQRPVESPQVASAGDEIPWDDPLDEQLASAAEAFARVEGNWYAQATAFDAVRYGLDQLERDLTDGGL